MKLPHTRLLHLHEATDENAVDINDDAVPTDNVFLYLIWIGLLICFCGWLRSAIRSRNSDRQTVSARKEKEMPLEVRRKNAMDSFENSGNQMVRCI
jgi:hypothetical protein